MAGNTNFPQGTKENPFEYLTYDFLCENNMWRGGWCFRDNRIFYISRDNFEYFEEGYNFGQIICPVPFLLYEEMHSIHIWSGGFVLMDSGDRVYMETDIIFPDGFNSSSEESSSSGSEASGSSGSSESEDSSSSSSSSDRDPVDSSSWLEEGSIDKKTVISAGEFVGELIDEIHGIYFGVKYTCTSGEFNHTTNVCTSQITISLDYYRSYGTEYRFYGNFRGIAAWMAPPMIAYMVFYDCIRLSDYLTVAASSNGVNMVELSTCS